MKKVVFILVLTLFTGVFSLVKAQDIITLREDGREIRATVTEVGDRDVKYKLYNDRSRQVYTLPKSRIFMIEYEDGFKDVFNARQTPNRRRTNDYNSDYNSDYDSDYGRRQETDFTRKGYAGIMIGGSFLSEDYNLENGVQINANFGYLFGRHIGITSSFLYTSYDLTKVDDASLGLAGFLVGPLVSFPLPSQKVAFDLRPTIGFVSIHAENDDDSDTDGSAMAVDLGGSVRWNVSRSISLSVNLDYIYHTEFEDYNIDLNSFGLTFGLNFRF
ncbi:MAG: porin family protein [Tannerella sp.]|jgi:hypothetical protein|nr:porin family protein [Tannerella sp.]